MKKNFAKRVSFIYVRIFEAVFWVLRVLMLSNSLLTTIIIFTSDCLIPFCIFCN